MITIVEDIICNAQKRFVEWVNIYAPWEGQNHTTERNLSFQFATAFLDLHPGGLVFMEVPFSTPPSTHSNNHLDAYLHTADFDLLLECKNIYAPSHIKMIKSDIERMNTNLIDQIHSRHKNKPVRTHGVVFVETWYSHVEQWWSNEYDGNKKAGKDEDLKLPGGWKYKSKRIYEHNKEPFETLYWLYGVSEPLSGKPE